MGEIKKIRGVTLYAFSKLHYKIHHNITKKYIWIYMQKNSYSSSSAAAGIRNEKRYGKEDTSNPTLPKPFEVTFDMFYAGLL